MTHASRPSPAGRAASVEDGGEIITTAKRIENGRRASHPSKGRGHPRGIGHLTHKSADVLSSRGCYPAPVPAAAYRPREPCRQGESLFAHSVDGTMQSRLG